MLCDVSRNIWSYSVLHCVHIVLEKELACGDSKSPAFRKDLQLSLKTRFFSYKITLPCAQATACQPRFEDVCFPNRTEKSYIKMLICTIAERGFSDPLEPARFPALWKNAEGMKKSAVQDISEQLATQRKRKKCVFSTGINKWSAVSIPGITPPCLSW